MKFKRSLFLITIFQSLCLGCQRNYEVTPRLTASVDAIVIDSFEPGVEYFVFPIEVNSNRSWTAEFRNPVDKAEEIDWVAISQCDAEFPSNTNCMRSVELNFDRNDSGSDRVCELVFHAAGGELIIPIKQKDSL